MYFYTIPLQEPEIHNDNNSDLTGAGQLGPVRKPTAPAPQPRAEGCYHKPYGEQGAYDKSS